MVIQIGSKLFLGHRCFPQSTLSINQNCLARCLLNTWTWFAKVGADLEPALTQPLNHDTIRATAEPSMANVVAQPTTFKTTPLVCCFSLDITSARPVLFDT